jgi:hypothetical protein
LTFFDFDTASYLFDPTVRVASFSGGSSYVIWAIWFYSYIVLVAILLLNVLLSIVVGSFVEFQTYYTAKGNVRYFDLGLTLKITLMIWFKYCVGSWMRMKTYCCKDKTKRSEKDEEEAVGSNRSVKSTPSPWQPYFVIEGMHLLKEKYRVKSSSGVQMRDELKEFFDEEVTEKILAQIRKESIQDTYRPDLLKLQAMNFTDDQYRARLFTMMENKVNRIPRRRNREDSSLVNESI